MAVRRAVAGDLPALLLLYGQLRPHEAPPSHDAARAALTEILHSPSTCILVAEIADGTLVASCGLTIIPTLGHGAQPFAVIENVVTHVDHRRRGHGRTVLQAACEAAKAAGCYKLCLSTGSKEETTLRFYESLGFKRDTKSYFEIRWEDADAQGA
jgi:ribosomal protein S18 acetylase RimI-like enzyme